MFDSCAGQTYISVESTVALPDDVLK